MISPGFPDLERFTDAQCQLAARHRRDQLLVEDFARLSQQALGSIKRTKHGNRLWPPQQPREHHRIDAAIDSLFAKFAKYDRAIGGTIDHKHTPPVRNDAERAGQMLRRDDQAGLVYDLAIGADLMGQAIEDIGLRLDFETANMAVDDGDIDTAGAVSDAEFVNDERVWAGSRMMQQAAMSRPAYICVFDLVPHARRIARRNRVPQSNCVRSCPAIAEANPARLQSFGALGYV